MTIEEVDLHGYWNTYRIETNSMEGSELYFEPGLGVFAWSRFGGTKQGSVFAWTVVDGRLTTRSVHGFASAFGSFEPLLPARGMGFDLREASLSWTEVEHYGTRYSVLQVERGRSLRPGPFDHHFERRGPTCPDTLTDQLRFALAKLEARAASPSPDERDLDESV